jgi:predicted permease
MALRFVRELRRNPMVMSSLAGLLVSLLGIEPPQALLRATTMLGSTCAPCALFSMGMVLSAQMSGALGPISLRDVLGPIVAVSGLRLLASPFIAYVILRMAGCTGDMLAAATVTFAMPVAVLVYILAERYEAKPAETSLTVIVSTLLSLVTLPLVMWPMP